MYTHLFSISHQNEECEMELGAATWVPKLYVDNATSEPKNDVWYIVKFDHQGCATVHERRRVKGNFFENMELNQFPFDTQVGLLCLFVYFVPLVKVDRLG
eukprot:GHVR01075297.1.p2 GENE.GHVR01075297.1~~GHVR01075297.1.p2  ORF type:complete len:100 (+),score=8.18 GHVR01075297.1:139-438(+)